MGISVEFDEKKETDLHGHQALETRQDFPDKKSLKRQVKTVMDDFECPECGGRKIKGDSVVAEIQKCNLYQQVAKKGFFGKKLVDEKQKSVYRLNSLYLKPSGFLQSAGYLKCKSCGWEEKAGSSIRWVSMADIFGSKD